MKLIIVFMLAASLFTFTSCGDRDSNESLGERMEETANDAGRNIKKTGRNMQEEACEMVNGKLECADDRLENTGKNIKDDAEDFSE